MKVNNLMENYCFDLCGCFIKVRCTHWYMNKLCEIISAIYNSEPLTMHSEIIGRSQIA
jgi:hypothetical protein